MIEKYFLFFTAVLGLLFGSFANVVVYRLPRGESIITPPSHCPSCNRRLALIDLIPVFSWLFLHGKCRGCGARISVRYPLIELLCSALFMCMYLYTGVSFDAVPLCMMVFMLLCVSVIDAETQEIPDGLLIFGAAVGALWIVSGMLFPAGAAPFLNAPDWREALLGAAAGAAPLFIIDRLTWLLIKKDGFGFGDVKLMTAAGLFLGWRLILAAFFFSFLAGGAYGAFLLITGRAKRGTYLAFGPFLAFGVLLGLWFGEGFIFWLLW